MANSAATAAVGNPVIGQVYEAQGYFAGQVTPDWIAIPNPVFSRFALKVQSKMVTMIWLFIGSREAPDCGHGCRIDQFG